MVSVVPGLCGVLASPHPLAVPIQAGPDVLATPAGTVPSPPGKGALLPCEPRAAPDILRRAILHSTLGRLPSAIPGKSPEDTETSSTAYTATL